MADIRLIIDVDASGVVKGSQIVRQEITRLLKQPKRAGLLFLLCGSKSLSDR